MIVAVYKPSEWLVCKEAKDRLPRQDIVLTPKNENRLFFVDKRYEQGLPLDENEEFYLGKSIAGLKLNQSAQNPITYLYPPEKDRIHITTKKNVWRKYNARKNKTYFEWFCRNDASKFLCKSAIFQKQRT